MSAYFTVSGEPENVTVIEKSRFICSLKNVNGEEEAREFIEKTRKKYSLANHHCYAYIADGEGRSFRFSDDGEPQGTAGLPILNALKSKNLSQNTQKVYLFTVQQYQSKYLIINEKNLQSYKTFLVDNYKINCYVTERLSRMKSRLDKTDNTTIL